MNKDLKTAQDRYYEHLASRAHEANRIICLATGEKVQLPWCETPEWQKESFINGVTFLYNNPQSTPAELHANWLKDKEANEWTLGSSQDAFKKEHPCMVPYDDLPLSQQAKDYMFRLAVLGTQELPELPKATGPKYFRCCPKLVNAVERLAQGLIHNDSRKQLIEEWNSVRNVNWFEEVR